MKLSPKFFRDVLRLRQLIFCAPLGIRTFPKGSCDAAAGSKRRYGISKKSTWWLESTPIDNFISLHLLKSRPLLFLLFALRWPPRDLLHRLRGACHFRTSREPTERACSPEHLGALFILQLGREAGRINWFWQNNIRQNHVILKKSTKPERLKSPCVSQGMSQN